jgi:hypothetical protein
VSERRAHNVPLCPACCRGGSSYANTWLPRRRGAMLRRRTPGTVFHLKTPAADWLPLEVVDVVVVVVAHAAGACRGHRSQETGALRRACDSRGAPRFREASTLTKIVTVVPGRHGLDLLPTSCRRDAERHSPTEVSCRAGERAACGGLARWPTADAHRPQPCTKTCSHHTTGISAPFFLTISFLEPWESYDRTNRTRQRYIFFSDIYIYQ